ncbi:hypothetical protein Hamer_G030585 [Homarus americanus]|uniref:Uncharacterized protein n=1 Tax=Homarus americanus TaxID=6706 RepID=A0A8J5MKV9_HOMAM|nr:hypothetical protein Hamer_G030585 [Homarus americanus]
MGPDYSTPAPWESQPAVFNILQTGTKKADCNPHELRQVAEKNMKALTPHNSTMYYTVAGQMAEGHLADGRFTDGHLTERTWSRRTFGRTDDRPTGHLAEWTHGNCLWRQTQGLGLQTWYNYPRNALIVKSVQALAFVPVSDVAESFNEFVSALDNETDELRSEFLGYFEATWIGVCCTAWKTTKTSIRTQAVEHFGEKHTRPSTDNKLS